RGPDPRPGQCNRGGRDDPPRPVRRDRGRRRRRAVRPSSRNGGWRDRRGSVRAVHLVLADPVAPIWPDARGGDTGVATAVARSVAMARPPLPAFSLLIASPVIRRIAWHARRIAGGMDKRFFLALFEGAAFFVL